MNEEKKFCGECNTTKTPLWRAGPHGPRSLCNACGIRYRKRKMSEDKQPQFPKPSSEIRPEESLNSESFDFVGENQINEALNIGYDYSEMDDRVVVLRSRSRSSSSSSSSPSKVKKQRSSSSEESVSCSNRDYEEVEQAAALLISLSCGSVFA